MKNGLKFSRLGVMALLSLSLLACGGDGDGGGNSNDVGKEVIVPVVDVAERALVTINSVAENADHTVTIHFSATNENDIALLGLSEPRFTVAKLVPEQDGKPSEWVSLINKVATSAIPDDTTKKLQATYDRDKDNAEGRFTDNGNGTYSFKLKETVLTAVNPLTGASIAWDANATHRVGMQVSGNANNVLNATYDWVPSGNGLVDARDIVDTATCNNCHGELKVHGSRVEAKYCVTCHNPGSTDPESGNSVDFTPMIHKIHRGANLPSMKQNGAVYEIVGYKGSVHTYAKNDNGTISGVELPQDIRNCSNCHTADNEATPQGDNWKTNAYLDACRSCHDDIAFDEADKIANDWKTQHPLGYREEGTCTGCHKNDGSELAPKFPHETVRNQAKAAADLLEISFIRVERVTGGNLEIDVQIDFDGSGVTNFATFAATYIGSGHGYLLVNADEGVGVGYTKSYGTVEHYLSNPDVCVPDTDGLYTCTIKKNVGTDEAPVWEPSITETGTLSLMTSDMNLCANAKSSTPELIDCTSAPTDYVQVETVPAKHVEGFYDLGDGTTPGVLAATTDYVEQIGADITGCTNCHADDGFHMGSHPHAATDLAQCTNCHNATRSSYYAGRPADLKSHVHTLHANNDSSHAMDSYPTDIETCTACHTDQQYDLNSMMNIRDSAAPNAVAHPDNIKIPSVTTYSSPIVTVCASCHIKDFPVGLIDDEGKMALTRSYNKNNYNGTYTLIEDEPTPIANHDEATITENQKWIDHMMKYGGKFGQTSASDPAVTEELCADCHAKGEDKAVDVAHGL